MVKTPEDTPYSSLPVALPGEIAQTILSSLSTESAPYNNGSSGSSPEDKSIQDIEPPIKKTL